MSWTLLHSCLFTVLLRLLSAPTGGATLREVSRLEYVAEPPGGLVPYRAGNALAYADTSGRLVIAPFGPWPGTSNSRFFQQGFVVIQPSLKKITPLSDTSPRRREPVRLVILNARGEVLLVRRSEAAVFQPDGSLVCRPHWQAHGLPELRALPLVEAGRSNYFNSWVMAPALSFHDQAPAHATGISLPDTLTWDRNLPYVEWVGIRRVARAQETTTKQGRLTQRFALGDWQGHLLTKFAFSAIQNFREGKAVAELASDPPVRNPSQLTTRTRSRPQFVYLDTLGRQLPNGVFDYAGPFCRGRAVVGVGSRMGVIDAQGHFLIPLGKHRISGPDAEGYLTLAKPDSAKGNETIQFLAPAGTPPIPQLFAEVQGFRQGRAEVRAGERAGLIDATGHWITAFPYEVLHTPGELRSAPEGADQYAPHRNEPESPRYSLYQPLPGPDSTLLVGRRAGKIGLVSRATGQEVVAARYDAVVLNPCHGIACLQRDGINYLVSAFNGQEVAATYQGYDFLTTHGRRLLVTRRSPAGWALADTLAQLRTPWVPGTGYLTPYGHLLSFEQNAATLYSLQGKTLLTAPVIVQPPSGSVWDDIGGNNWYRAASSDELVSAHYQLRLDQAYPAAQGVYFALNQASQTCSIYDANLRQLAKLFLPPADSKQQFHLLVSGWSMLVEHTGTPRSYQTLTKGFFTDTGHPLPVPPAGMSWAPSAWGDLPRLWQTYGLLPVTAGYMTKGRRQLWQD